MPICKQCDKKFPNSIRINGVRKKLDTRSFCLECSPYGQHNTRNLLTPFKDAKRKNAEYMALYYQEKSKRKTMLVKLKGGRCQQCGYDKCEDVLCFHHRNPMEKAFALTKGIMWKRPWAEVLAEVDKCDLLCANCHGELHARNKTKWVANINGDVLDS